MNSPKYQDLFYVPLCDLFWRMSRLHLERLCAPLLLVVWRLSDRQSLVFFLITCLVVPSTADSGLLQCSNRVELILSLFNSGLVHLGTFFCGVFALTVMSSWEVDLYSSWNARLWRRFLSYGPCVWPEDSCSGSVLAAGLTHPARYLVSAYRCLWLQNVSLADSVQQSDVSVPAAHSYPMLSVADISVSALLFVPYTSRVFFVPASLAAFRLWRESTELPRPDGWLFSPWAAFAPRTCSAVRCIHIGNCCFPDTLLPRGVPSAPSLQNSPRPGLFLWCSCRALALIWLPHAPCPSTWNVSVLL